ncbi:hypothetical protein Q5Y75_25645 [Ruegeria sp. 2205SS24-7]|uniref:hypothetical protein n=1 Tax=Ruegeria discodermiae TaxID=3064389 RepID=UPI002741FFF4|nr:hypothetical protein [Ruegeria sp. 2205SS24-7]MDP5220575.1 hypothetical protein [Ruegeria sp. 2205SS24-7]
MESCLSQPNFRMLLIKIEGISAFKTECKRHHATALRRLRTRKKQVGPMIGRTALKTLFLLLPIGLTGPVIAEAPDAKAATPSGSVDIVAVFNATCASGRTTAASLRESFEAQGFTTDWQNDTYGYFTRAGFAANYHIYPGSWNCFVSAESAVTPDLCEILSVDGIEVSARLPDGTCVANIPEHGLTVLVRNICPDSSHGACTWVQATLTSDRECRADEVVDLAVLARSIVNSN